MKNQVNALAVLSVGEIEQVSGAGTFLGDAIINGVYAANSFLNSPLFSSIGNAASAIGDDRLQQQSQGRVVPDAFTHGTSAQRVRWFRTGFDSGEPGRCDTFKAPRL